MKEGTNKLGNTAKSSKQTKHLIKISFCVGCIFFPPPFQKNCLFLPYHRLNRTGLLYGAHVGPSRTGDGCCVCGSVGSRRTERQIPVWQDLMSHCMTQTDVGRGPQKKTTHSRALLCWPSIYIFLCLRIALTASNFSFIRFGPPTLALKFKNLQGTVI